MGKASKEDYQTAAGLSMPFIVFLVFLILKLTNLIGWSWWWVTSPLWIVAAIIILLSIISWTVFYIRYKRYKRKH